MRIADALACRRTRSIGAGLLLAASAGLTAAAPDDVADPLLALLADKGLAAAPATAPSAGSSEPAAPDLLGKVHEQASDMVLSAMNFIGVHYRRGGASAESGFDCSGFTRHVYEMSLGLVLPHRADAQAAAPGLVAVKREELKPGDLVFFNTMRRTFSHVGIYIGDNRFIHAPRRGKDVRTDDLGFAYWARRFTGARRVEALDPPAEMQARAAAMPGEQASR
jgi:cell wall-associated NlpC family hydrolase